jgi:hypothetical protein
MDDWHGGHLDRPHPDRGAFGELEQAELEAALDLRGAREQHLHRPDDPLPEAGRAGHE